MSAQTVAPTDIESSGAAELSEDDLEHVIGGLARAWTEAQAEGDAVRLLAGPRSPGVPM